VEQRAMGFHRPGGEPGLHGRIRGSLRESTDPLGIGTPSPTPTQPCAAPLHLVARTAMARPPAHGSVIVPDWHETAEGKEYLACILRKNRRRVFGKGLPPQPVSFHPLGRTVSPVAQGWEAQKQGGEASFTAPLSPGDSWKPYS
jgi:hypothetical protein